MVSLLSGKSPRFLDLGRCCEHWMPFSFSCDLDAWGKDGDPRYAYLQTFATDAWGAYFWWLGTPLKPRNPDLEYLNSSAATLAVFLSEILQLYCLDLWFLSKYYSNDSMNDSMIVTNCYSIIILNSYWTDKSSSRLSGIRGSQARAPCTWSSLHSLMLGLRVFVLVVETLGEIGEWYGYWWWSDLIPGNQWSSVVPGSWHSSVGLYNSINSTHALPVPLQRK